MTKFGQFTNTLSVTWLPMPRSGWFSPWRTFLARRVALNDPLLWVSPSGERTSIPKGFETDGPSFPAILQPLLPSRWEYAESGVLHDYLCREGYDLAWCDAQFRVALRSQGVGGFYAWICYAGLRIAAPFRDEADWSWLNIAAWVWRRR